MKTKVAKYGIRVKGELITTYATSALAAMDYFYKEGYVYVSMADILLIVQNPIK